MKWLHTIKRYAIHVYCSYVCINVYMCQSISCNSISNLWNTAMQQWVPYCKGGEHDIVWTDNLIIHTYMHACMHKIHTIYTNIINAMRVQAPRGSFMWLQGLRMYTLTSSELPLYHGAHHQWSTTSVKCSLHWCDCTEQWTWHYASTRMWWRNTRLTMEWQPMPCMDQRIKS